MTKLEFQPAPGTYIVEEIKDDTGIILNSKGTRLLKGKVIAVGDLEHTDYGEFIAAPVQENDIAYFLSYEGDYDNVIIAGKKYYCVLRKDHRFVLNP